MPPGTDRAQWQHLARAFGAKANLIRDWSEVSLPEGTAIILADEKGAVESRDFAWPTGDIALVFGRSGQDLPVAQHSSIKVATPEPISMFGITAAAVILRDRQQWLLRS